MTSPLERFQSLTAEQQQALLAQLASAPEPTAAPVAVLDEPAPQSFYDMAAAIPVTFKADLVPSPKARDASFAATYDHVWCKGHYQVKGPKGGVYFVGRAVLGVKRNKQLKGILKISNTHFLSLQAGKPVDGWMRIDGQKDAVLLGVLQNFRPA